jgi:hypothetical protein
VHAHTPVRSIGQTEAPAVRLGNKRGAIPGAGRLPDREGQVDDLARQCTVLARRYVELEQLEITRKTAGANAEVEAPAGHLVELGDAADRPPQAFRCRARTRRYALVPADAWAS